MPFEALKNCIKQKPIADNVEITSDFTVKVYTVPCGSGE
jgi:hypothetical protein